MKELKNSNDNFPLTPEEREKRIELASKHFGDFMNVLGFDYETCVNSKDTPRRVAKAYIDDLASGCFTKKPKITAFDNVDGYDGIVAQTNIPFVSMCAHHWLPFTGVAHVAYIPQKDGKIIGLSKLNRIVDWIGRRPSCQENATSMIADMIDEVCTNNRGVAVVVEAKHTCCSLRGIRHDSTMRTAKMTGVFLEKDNNARNEFYKFVEFAKTEK